MSVARSVLGRSLQSAVRTPRAAAVTQALRLYTTESKNLKREIISEKQVPVTAFQPDGPSSLGGTSTPHHLKVPVGSVKSDAAAEPTPALTPLSQDLYAKLPATVQKMTVMGKVVIVTG